MDIKVEGGAARPYTGSTRMTGYFLAVRADGTIASGEFGRRYFASPADVEAFLAEEASR